MEWVADSKARKDAEAVIARAGQAAAELEQQQQREQAAVDDGVRKIADGILKLTHRLDQLEQERETRRAPDAATEVTQQMLAIPKDAPDPEAPADETSASAGELTVIPPSHPADSREGMVSIGGQSFTAFPMRHESGSSRGTHWPTRCRFLRVVP
jgi:hypothetical protein